MKKALKRNKRIKISIAFAVLFALNCFLFNSFTYAETYDGVIDKAYNVHKESIYDISLNAPFAKDKSGVRETIDPETGSVTVSYALFTLKGMGGEAEETITLVYNNRTASIKEESAEYNNEEQSYVNITAEKSVFKKSALKLGIGWQINMPHIEPPNDKNKTETYVYMPDGRVFQKGSTESGLKGYKLSDVVFSTTTEEINGTAMSYVLRYANGDSYYFNSKGFLCRKSDKFNNTIDYIWSNESVPVLEKIANNWGDMVEFSYTDTDITVRYKNRKYIINRSKSDSSYMITSIKDPGGRETGFSYSTQALKFDFFSQTERLKTGSNSYKLLKKIKYSSGLETRYNYHLSRKWLYEANNGFIQYSKISSREDVDGGKTLNKVTYSYQNQPDGFPRYKSGSLPKDYTYFTTETDSFGAKTIYTYNSNHYQTQLIKAAEGKATAKEIRKYDSLTKMPELFERTTYYPNGNSRTEYEKVRFDKRGNVIYSDKYIDSEKTEENVRTYEYSYGTNMCVYESYMKDKDTKVEIRRTLNHGGNSFTSETLYENGREVKKDEFDYTSNGKLTMSKIQTGKTEHLITKYLYNGQNSFKYPIKVTMGGVRDADGNLEGYTTEYKYDDYGNCTEATDNNKNITRFVYDSLDRVTKEVLEDGKSRDTIYNDKENTITKTNANGLKLLYFYDKCGKLIKIVDTNSDEVLLENKYDEKERLVRETDVLGTSYTYTYDEFDRKTSLVVYDKDDNVISEKYTVYDDACATVDGVFTKMTLKEGLGNEQRVTEYFFDNENRLVQQHNVSGEDRRIYRYEYDFSDNLVAEISPTGLETKHSYDVFGNVIYTLHPDDTEEFFEYDFQGNCIMSENGEGERVYYTFDSLSRKIKTEIPDGERVNIFKTYYDYRGNAVKDISAEGDVTVNTYNERGLLENAQQYSSASEGTQSEYTYDGEGNLTKMSYGAIGGENRISYEFVLDVYGRCIREIDNMGQVTENEYDSLGNLIYQKDRNGIVTRYQYDGLSRNIEKTNDKNGFLQYEYTDFGEVCGVTDGTAKQKVKYNSFGETTEIIRDKTSDFFEYDDEGRLTSKIIEDKDMGTVTNCYTYDKRGNVTSIETGMGVEYITYDKAGRITKKENSQSGIAKTYSYYPTGLVKDVLTWQNDEVVYTESYEYDQNGNKIYEDLNGEIKRYAYDGMGRLKTVTDKNGNITEYEFDDFGNISKEYDISERGIKTKQYYYDSNNRLIMSDSPNETAQYEYDNAGNLLEKTTGYGGRIKKTYYRYDGYNRLSEYISGDVVSEYTYNLDGLRESKTVGGKYTRFMYDGMNIIGELCEGDYYIYHRGTELIGCQSYSGKSYYYRQDNHGNVTALLDFAGKEVKNYKYDAYGEPQGTRLNPAGDQTIIYQWKAETERVYNPFGFCGEYSDAESGLIYLRNRYYDPSTGRFINEDPVNYGLNWYVYCHNDPVNFKDLWGETEYYVNGEFPKFTFDHTFPYNPDEVATQADYKSWKHWNTMAWGSGFAPWLRDASKSYKHYLGNTGKDMWVDYERAYKEDKVIKSYIDSEIDTMKNATKWLYDNNWGTSFNITGEIFGIPNGDSENWQKTIGAHQVFGVGQITIDKKTGKATMIATFYMEDMYNFNPGMADIASGTPDDVNGRFSELGWAKEFKSYGSFKKTITWQLFEPAKNNRDNGGGNGR